MKVTPLCGALGARVEGLDLAADISNAEFAALHEAFLDHLVLVFPEQDLPPEAHVGFTRRFGPVEPHPLRSRRGAEGFPEVLVLENKPGQPGARNDRWHSDITCAERPPALSVLHALTIPGGGRGDTMFCNMYAAYDGVSAGLRAMLDRLSAQHNAEWLAVRNSEPGSDGLPIQEIPPPVTHPVVRTHPESGRRALFVNPGFTIGFEGWSRAESAPLLSHLYARATAPENVYRHRWSQGDVLMWDNRCTMHYAVYDYDDSMPRLMHRTTAAGDRPS